MKQRSGQAGWVIIEALHQLARIAMMLLLLALALLGLLAFRLSFGPLELPALASRLASAASGDGISVRMDKAELAWAGYHQGGGVPLVLQLGNISVRSAAGVQLAFIPLADAVVPPVDFFGGRAPILLRASAARFTMASAPVSGLANITPGPGFSLAQGDVDVTLGPGLLGQGAASVAISGASFALHAAPGALDIANGKLTLAPFGGSAPHGTFSFTARRQTAWTGVLHATIDAVRAQELGQYWPAPLLHLTRKWVLQNITAGTARNAAFDFSLTAPADLASLRLTNATGSFTGQDLTLYWLDGGVPITGLNGVFAMPDMDEAVITAPSGQVQGVALTQGNMHITNMTHKDQVGALQLSLAGTVPDLFAVLDAPPLTLLQKGPPGLATATGTAEGQLSLIIPFKPHDDFADLTLHVAAKLHNVAMPFALPPLGFTGGEVQLQTDGHTLQLQAKADYAGEPAQVKLDANFAPHGQETLNLSGAAGPQLWHFLGLDDDSELDGPANAVAPFTLAVTGPANGLQTAAVHADLTPVALAVPSFGWHKAAGDAGFVSLLARLHGNAPAGVQSFTARAAGLNVQAAEQNGIWIFSALDIGRTQATGSLTPPKAGAPWVAQFSGAALYVHQPKQSTAPPSATAEAAGAGPPTGPAWTARLQFNTLYLADAPAPGLPDFSLDASGRGGTLLQGQAQAQALTLTVTPSTPTRRALALHSLDAGTLFRALGEYGHLSGGTLDLDGVYGGGEPTIGTAKLQNARFVNAPDLTKLLQAVTVYGVADATSGPGLEISHAVVPFSLQHGVLQLQGARAYSSSLGFTFSGSINLVSNTCDLNTTIVPAYALNTLPGRLPLVGRIFSAEKGGGLIAVRARISGPVDDADVTVNPLSALTPGFLRGIFGLGETAPTQH
jgi:hypothetical protein